MSSFQKINRLNVLIENNFKGHYLDTNLEFTDKQPTEPDSKKIILKIEGLIVDFLSTANLYDEQTTTILVTLKDRIRCNRWFDLYSIANRLASIDLTLNFIKTNRIPREFVHIKGCERQIPELPSDALYATIIIDDSLSDKLSWMACLDAIQDRIPLILTSRTFSSLMTYETLAKEYWVFQDFSKHIVICYPKEPNREPLDVLHERGFNTSQLSIIETIECFQEKSYKQYSTEVSSKLPLIFSDRPIPKRFYFVGHGCFTSKLSEPDDPESTAWYAGLAIDQFRILLEKLEAKGMDYGNGITCFGSSKNLLEVFADFSRKHTFSLCNISDVCPTYEYSTPGDNYVNTQLHKTALFWNHISIALKNKGEALRPKDFRSALECIYGCNWAGIPVISVMGSKHFSVVNVHKRSVVITYRKLSRPLPVIQADRECLLIYPQIVKSTVTINRLSSNQQFPIVISMVHDHNQILFSEVQTSEGSPLTVIREAFLKDNLEEKLEDRSPTDHLYIVRKFIGKTESFTNVLACYNDRVNYCIYQRQTGQWFLSLERNHEARLSSAEASLLIYENFKRIRTSKEGIEFSGEGEAAQSLEDVRKQFRDWFGLNFSSDFIQSLENIDSNAFDQFSSKLSQEEVLQLLFHAVNRKKWNAIPVLSCKLKQFDREDCFKRKILHLMIERGSPCEMINLLLDRGADVSLADSRKLTPLYYAAMSQREDVIQLLIERGADINAPILNSCLINFVAGKEKEDFALLLMRKYGAKGFGTSILQDLRNSEKWGDFFNASLDQLRKASKDHIEFSVNFLRTMLVDESELINGWQFLPASIRAALTAQFVKALTDLKDAQIDFSFFSKQFLTMKWCIPEEDFKEITTHILVQSLSIGK